MATEPSAKRGSRLLVSQIVEHVKSQGIFDQFRRDCIEELEEKESYRQLKQRVESHVATFLSKQTWSDVLPKNQVRDSLRKHINQSEVLDRGVNQLISQALESKAKAFHTRIEGVVQNYIYMHNHPQRQDRQPRKHKTVETKEEAKPSASETICDISQLIPVPSSSGSKTSESSNVDRGKAGTQEGSKGGSSTKSMQQIKKSHLTQGKTGKGDEPKTGGPSLRDKDQAEDNSRAKDGKIKTARVKAESLIRDDHGRSSPKPDENLHKTRDEKTKISRVKVEKNHPSGGHFSSVAGDSGTLNYQEEKTSTLKGTRESLVQNQFSSSSESDFFQGDVARLSYVKAEKANESPSSVCCSSEYKVKVKDENAVPFREKVKAESSKCDSLVHLQQEEVIESKLKCYDSEKEHNRKLCDEGISEIATGMQRSDNFIKNEAALLGENVEKIMEWRDVDASPNVSESQRKELENSERLAILKQTEVIGILENKVDNKPEGRREEESSGRMRTAPASHPSIELPVAQEDEELPSDKEERATEMIGPMVESQRQTMSDEKGLLPRHEEDEVGDESVYEMTGSEVSSVLRDTTGEVCSTGEYSDRESDISEVSSVHTSDLSSFDDELSSSSESYEERANETQGNEGNARNEDQEKSSAQSQSEQDSDVAPRRRSTRISSRRSTKEGESELSEGEGSRIRTDSPRKRRHGEKRERKPRPESAQRQTESGREKRGRGRPRKDNRPPSDSSRGQMRRSRIHDKDCSGTAVERGGNGAREDRTKRSQRTIKRTRCYSPSSEGTREVFLPRKRSRDGPS